MVNRGALALFVQMVFLSVVTAAATADLATMEKARELYAGGKLKEAIAAYSRITPTSDFWLDALEERAWAKTRQGHFEGALGDLQSITSAVWSSQVGPETYMLSTFVSLKICAYKDVVKKIGIFKKRMLPRIDSLQKILDEPLPLSFHELVPAIKKDQVSMSSLGNRSENFPRYFYRDQKLLSLINANDKAGMTQRMRELAQADLDEIEVNLKKMKVIEVELIQKVLMADDLKQKDKNLKFAKVDKNQKMVFPVDDDEVWIDEVGHYQVRATKCPFSAGSTL